MNLFHSLFLAVAIFFRFSEFAEAQNDKQVIGDAVLTPDEIAAGATVMYLIRFQNLSGDTAQHVVVRDTLDPRLDPATFLMKASSHEFDLLRNNDGDVLRWYFNDIHLPDGGSDDPGSHGFILFTIQPKSFLSPGQVIDNQAFITFADNAPSIPTNHTYVWIDEGAPAVEPEIESKLRIAPNPNRGEFQILHYDAAVAQPASPDHDVTWWITDMQGKTVIDGAAPDAAAAGNLVMMERPMPGLYLLWVESEGRLQVEQFAVIR